MGLTKRYTYQSDELVVLKQKEDNKVGHHVREADVCGQQKYGG